MKKFNKMDFLCIVILYLFVIGFVLFLRWKGYIFGSDIDWISQHSIIPEYFRTLFYNTGSLIPNFAFNLGMGQNIFYLSYYGLLSPIILISYLLPSISMANFIQIASVVMLLVSIGLFYSWIRGKYNTKIAFLTGVIFTLAGPLIFHSHRHIMFVIYMPFLIGAFKSIDSYFNKKSAVPLVICVFLMIMTSYYFSVSGIFILGIYCIYKILQNNKKFKWENFKPILNIIYFVMISILMAATLLLPTIYALKTGRLETNDTVSLLSLFIPTVTYKLTFYYSYSLGLTFIYVVSLIHALLNKKKENIFASAFLFICMLFPVVSYLLNGLMYVDGKCFIPFIPFAVLIIGDFLNDLFKDKVNIKRLMYYLIPFTVFMLYCAIGYSSILLLVIDIILTIGTLFLIKKYHKPILIFIPIIFVSLFSFTSINGNESYVSVTELSEQTNKAYSELLNTIDDTNLYRTANDNMILNNVNNIYTSNDYITSIYSSSSNKYYANFIRNIFQNEIINKDNLTFTQTSNVLFNIYSGTKYLLTSSEPAIGYELTNTIDGVSLYENDDVLPIGYSTDNVMSLREFKTLEYPYNLDALLNYVIVNKSLDNVYTSHVDTYDTDLNVMSTNNLNYTLNNDMYYVTAKNNATATIKLDSSIKNKVLIIELTMNKQKEGYGCSTDITINGVTNSLSCTNWKYNNNNTTFEYVLSSNDSIDTLNLAFTKGDYEISDIKLYTMDYNQIKTIKNNVSELVIDQDKSKNNTIIGSINASEDGYVKLTIPYENDGYKIYLDNKEVSQVLVDETFIGFEIAAGEHTIKIVYNTPYLEEGIIISIIGFVLFILLCIYKFIEKAVHKIMNCIWKYITWVAKKIWSFIKKYNGYVYLFFSLYILDLALRIVYSGTVNFYGWYRIVPNLFSILWILLILFLTNLFNRHVGKSFYIICYVFILAMFLVNSVYFSYFKQFFDFSVLMDAGEGAEYYDTVLKNIDYWVVIIGIISVLLTIRGLRLAHFRRKIQPIRLLLILSVFVLLHLGLPIFLGSKESSIEWNDWSNPRIIYSTFNDNNKSMMVAGLFEYNVRDFYVNYIKNNKALSDTEESVLEENFDDATVNEGNQYTGLFAGKNLMFIQLESIDDFLVTKSIMPTLYSMTKNSINFTQHYSFTSGGGSTFNSEFMVNTGYSTSYNYSASAYLFSRNTYTYSMANLFKNLGYTVNAYHMNTSEYYSRGVNYKAFGYDNYYSLKELGDYTDNSYWLDTELVNNKTFNKLIFNNTALSVSYIITYSAHMPYSSDKGVCSLLTDEEGLTEYECLKLQAKETDDFLALLLDNLEANGMLDNTVLVIYADHYDYTLEDQSILKKYKDTTTNLINHTPFIIWSNGLLKKTVKDVNSQLDILPTILNLFGVEYYPNYYIGSDILDPDYDPLVFFSDGSWYNGSTYVTNGEDQTGKKLSEETLAKYNSLVKYKMTLNDAILKSDYFAKD